MNATTETTTRQRADAATRERLAREETLRKERGITRHPMSGDSAVERIKQAIAYLATRQDPEAPLSRGVETVLRWLETPYAVPNVDHYSRGVVRGGAVQATARRGTDLADVLERLTLIDEDLRHGGAAVARDNIGTALRELGVEPDRIAEVVRTFAGV